METQVKKITLGLVISWILGIVFLVSGVIQLFSNLLAGVLFVITSLVLLPPINKLLKQKMNFSLSGVLKFFIVLILLIIIGVVLSKGKNNGLIGDSSAVPTTQTQVSEEVIKITAIKLSEDYGANKVAADAKYEDKLLEISGTIDSIGKDILDTPYVTLAGKQFSLFGLQCMFARSDELQLATLSKGQTITLQGRVSGELIGNVIARGCEIVR